MNNIELTGRLVADPAGKELPDSGYVCEMRIAVDGMGRGGRDQAGYVDVHSFGESAKAAAKVLSKGWLVAVAGPPAARGLREGRPEALRLPRDRVRRVPRRPPQRRRRRRPGGRGLALRPPRRGGVLIDPGRVGRLPAPDPA